MAVGRRSLLGLALATPALAAAGDAALRAERSLGGAQAPQTAAEFFSLTCPHCAAFAQEALPEIRAKWIASGQLRWVFRDFPSDRRALQAAVVARYLPPEDYDRFIDTLFASQQRWAYGDDSQTVLRLLASDAGMDQATFDHALVDTALRDWIVGQAMEAESRWHVSATPSFLIKGRLYEGAMPASEFARILAS